MRWGVKRGLASPSWGFLMTQELSHEVGNSEFIFFIGVQETVSDGFLLFFGLQKRTIFYSRPQPIYQSFNLLWCSMFFYQTYHTQNHQIQILVTDIVRIRHLDYFTIFLFHFYSSIDVLNFLLGRNAGTTFGAT